MPVVLIRKRRFFIWWKKEWDKRLLLISRKCRKGKFVDWVSAKHKGYTDILPDLSNRAFSKRLCFLKIKRNPVKFRKFKTRKKYYPSTQNLKNIRTNTRIRKEMAIKHIKTILRNNGIKINVRINRRNSEIKKIANSLLSSKIKMNNAKRVARP